MPKAVVSVTWRLDPKVLARIQAAASARGLSMQAFASEALARRVAEANTDGEPQAEDRAWLDAPLGGGLPPYDWGPEGAPRGRPVRYVPGKGLVIEGGRS